MDLARPLHPVPALSLRPWAGRRLGEGIGERWVAGPDSVVSLPNGTDATLDELAARTGPALIGTAGMALLGPRFPLLCKLIDAGEWLSLQVHPDDRLARALYGADAVGKDEAWAVIAAEPGARLVIGPSAGADAASVRNAVASGAMDLAACEVRVAVPGDVFNVPAGTVHAIGAGVFVYEIEQPSDLTFRISDWGRPPTPGRRLHLDEAGQAVDPARRAILAGSAWRLDGGRLEADRLRLEVLGPADDGANRAPGGRSPEVITAIEGGVVLAGDGWSERLEPLDTVVIAAGVAAYRIEPEAGARALVGSLPG